MKYVLFVYTHKAGRSQMAQAFFERYAPSDLHAESAGQDPADAIWPNVVEANGGGRDRHLRPHAKEDAAAAGVIRVPIMSTYELEGVPSGLAEFAAGTLGSSPCAATTERRDAYGC